MAQLTPFAVVPATFQVTVCVEPAVQETAVLGALTTNGPAAAVTVTTISVNWVCPTLMGAVELYGQLSLTVNLKFKVLATELKASDNIPASPPT